VVVGRLLRPEDQGLLGSGEVGRGQLTRMLAAPWRQWWFLPGVNTSAQVYEEMVDRMFGPGTTAASYQELRWLSQACRAPLPPPYFRVLVAGPLALAKCLRPPCLACSPQPRSLLLLDMPWAVAPSAAALLLCCTLKRCHTRPAVMWHMACGM